MIPAIIPLPSLLAPLSQLHRVADGPVAYYRAILNSDDRFLASSAWCRLLDAGGIDPSQWEALISACQHGAVKARAFDYFENLFEHRMAQRVAAAATPSKVDIRTRAMQARLAFDHAAEASIQGEYYFDTDDIGHLVNAAQFAELDGGFRSAATWLVRAVAAAPMVNDVVVRLCMLLLTNQERDLLRQLIDILRPLPQYANLARAFGAADLLTDDPRACLDALADIDDALIAGDPTLPLIHSKIHRWRADALDKVGRYTEAFETFVLIKSLERKPGLDGAGYLSSVSARGRVDIPPLRADPRSEVVSMLGFPRSGTTLLENALASHPNLETFEEIPAHKSCVETLARRLSSNGLLGPNDFLAARDAYYTEIDIRRRKVGARVLIDKMPIHSAEAKFTHKLFPARRYLFSIRHPFDVVLSCLRQNFTPNDAMDNFRDVRSAIAAYDFAMTKWFGEFGLGTADVCYIRYDDLVTQFEPTVRGVLGFLDVNWSDDVLGFAENAKLRAMKTPSYVKVRQGLSIGVQTQWRNYGFLFQSLEAAPLHKWAEFFGYPTK